MIPNPLVAVGLKAWLWASLAALVAMAVVIGAQRLQVGALRVELAGERQGRAADKAAAATAWGKESERIRAEEAAGRKVLQEKLDEERAKSQAARADAAIADAAAGKLQQRVASLVAAAREAARNPAPAASGPPAEDAAGMLADVLGQCVTRVRLLATVADERGIAGATCVGAYEALTPAHAEPAKSSGD